MPPIRRTDPLVIEAIQALALITHKTGGAIYSELKARPELAGFKFSLKTVERVVKDMRPAQEKSEIWSLADSDGADSRRILRVLAYVIIESKHRVTFFTKMEAEWVLRLSYAAPGLDALRIWLLGKLYQIRLTRETPNTQDLDAYVAFRPWINDDGLNNYKRVVEQGLKPVPMWDWLVEPQTHYVESGELIPGWNRRERNRRSHGRPLYDYWQESQEEEGAGISSGLEMVPKATTEDLLRWEEDMKTPRGTGASGYPA